MKKAQNKAAKIREKIVSRFRVDSGSAIGRQFGGDPGHPRRGALIERSPKLLRPMTIRQL